ncbi:MAG TPA: LPS assembly lipoprotein LptE [Gemmatimonadaceae bacterium]|nr:LPS assembly lipoprotein LptE [Gemmatimonadaceae bacterium]
MRRFGARTLLVASALGGIGCYGFAGGGLPPQIHTIAVLPFDNETSQPTLQRDLYDPMRRELTGRLGLHEASEAKADAIVRGKIVRYDVDIPVAYSADPNLQNATTQRRLQLTVDVDIVDQTTGKNIWSRKGLMQEGTYAERDEVSGRRQAVAKIVDQIVAGAQSQW